MTEEQTMTPKGNKPVKKYRDGTVTLAVWENIGKDNVTWPTYQIQRSYKDKEDQWQNTGSLRKQDLLTVAALCQQAHRDGIAIDDGNTNGDSPPPPQ